jgi:hypothetical protein
MGSNETEAAQMNVRYALACRDADYKVPEWQSNDKLKRIGHLHPSSS